MDMDRAYENVAFIPGGADYPDRWASEAEAYRTREAAIGRARLNVAYGPGERQKLDLFHPAGKAEGLVMFIHGGYWLKFDRAYWSHLAAGVTARGWAMAVPSYRLAPEARISQITRDAAAALEAAAGLIAGPIRVTGHSAGGHLTARLLCRDVVLASETRGRIAKAVPISPVADLRPFPGLKMNDGLRLDAEEAEAESPVLHPAPDVPVTVWVGAEERPVFLDQARWLTEAWGAELRIGPGRHHFDVIEGLEDPACPLTDALLG